MCIIQADNFNLNILISQVDAKIIADLLTAIPSKDLLELAATKGYKPYDTCGACYSFASNVAKVLEILDKIRVKHTQPEEQELPSGLVQ